MVTWPFYPEGVDKWENTGKDLLPTEKNYFITRYQERKHLIVIILDKLPENIKLWNFPRR